MISLGNCVECQNDEEKKFKRSNTTNDLTKRFIRGCCIFACVLLWFFSPFIALCGAEIDRQHSAFQILVGDVTFWGNVEETMPFWIAIGIGICLAICAVSYFFNAKSVMRWMSVIADVIMLIPIIEFFDWKEGSDNIFNVIGIGFWGIFVLLLVLFLVSGGSRKT